MQSDAHAASSWALHTAQHATTLPRLPTGAICQLVQPAVGALCGAASATMASGTGDAQASLVRDLPPLPRISLGRQLRVMLWKNWVLTKRNPRDLLREWLWPIVLLIVLVVLRTSLRPVTTAAEPHNDLSVLPPLSALVWCAWQLSCGLAR